jgi:hypothetical protein
MPEAIAQDPGAGCPPPVPVMSASRRAPLVVITPCCRPELLRYVHDSVRFPIVTRWIIVFDADQVPRAKLPAALLDDPHVTLVATQTEASKYGNAQRYLGLQIARRLYPEDDPFIYFLDDDNVIHPAFYELFERFMQKRGVFYTFDQQRAWLTCSGRSCVRVTIDTAMICLPLSFCPDWHPGSVYAEDYYFIQSVMRKYGDRHVYLNQVGAYYNALQPRAVTRLLGAQPRNHAAVAGMVMLITLAVSARKLLRRSHPHSHVTLWRASDGAAGHLRSISPRARPERW